MMSINPTLDLIMSRRSRRRFSPDPVPKELLDAIVQAGRMAPTGHNDQELVFHVVNDFDKLCKFGNDLTMNASEPLKAMFIKAKKPDGPTNIGTYDAPAAVIITAPKTFELRHLDAGFAAESMLIAAESVGLRTVPVCALITASPRVTHEFLGTDPEKDDVLIVVLIGKPHPEYDAKFATKKDLVSKVVYH